MAQVGLLFLSEAVDREVDIVVNRFFTVANDHDVSKIRQGLRIDIGHGAPNQNEGVVFVALGCQQRNTSEFQHP